MNGRFAAHSAQYIQHNLTKCSDTYLNVTETRKRDREREENGIARSLTSTYYANKPSMQPTIIFFVV